METTFLDTQFMPPEIERRNAAVRPFSTALPRPQDHMGHPTRKNISHLANPKIAQMADVSARVFLYTESG